MHDKLISRLHTLSLSLYIYIGPTYMYGQGIDSEHYPDCCNKSLVTLEIWYKLCTSTMTSVLT